MAVNEPIRIAGPFVGDGSLVELDFDFETLSASDVTVATVNADGIETPLTLDDDYTITLNSGSAGGSVALLSPLATGLTAYVYGDAMAYVRTGNIISNPGGFFPAVVNAALDRVHIALIQLATKVVRSPSIPLVFSAVVGKYPVVMPDGSFGWASGTGADSGLRGDLGSVTDPDQGSSIFSFFAFGGGSIARTGRAKLAERLTPEDKNAAGTGIADDRAAFQSAADQATAQGVTLRGRRGAIYRIGSGLILPAGFHFDGEGCTIKAATHMDMLTLLGSARIVNCVIEGPDDGGYDAAGKGIVCHGVAGAGAGLAPTMIEDVAVEGVKFVGIGHTGLDLWYCSGVRNRDLAFERMGYAAVLGYSIEDFDGKGFNVDTIYGETTSGQMNAYAVSFTSEVNGGDDVRYPPSRRCYAHEGKVRDMQTWHALDTHGGRQIGFQDWDMYDVRRAVALTNRGDDSAHDSYVKRIRSFNNLPFALGVDGEPTAPSVNAGVSYGGASDALKKDSAVWVTGISASPSRNIQLDDIYAEGHGRPGQINGSFYFEHCDIDARGLADKSGYINGIYCAAGVTGRIEHKSLNLVAWDDGAYPGGSYGFTAFDTTRPIDMRGGNVKYQGAVERTNAKPAGTFDLDYLVVTASATNTIQFVGNGVRGKAANGNFVSGDADYIRGDFDRSVTLAATGFAAPLNVDCVQSRTGDVISLDFTAASATSNDAAFTLGTLGVNFRPVAQRIVMARGQDNGVACVLLLSIATNGVITVFKDVGANAFTATGAKGIAAQSVTFQA